jgi:beta-lactamase superfamily II metal-dependent hydrolase
MVIQPIAQVLMLVAWVCLQYTITVVQATASVPYAALEVGRLEWPAIALCYALIFGSALKIPWRGLRSGLLTRPALAVSAIIATVLIVWSVNLGATDNKTHVYFFDTGAGPSVFVKTARGARILIDGGLPSTTLSALGQQMPFYDRALDLIIRTNGDEDNLNALSAVAERYAVTQMIEPPRSSSTTAFQRWRELVAQKTLPGTAGMKMTLDDASWLEVVYPPEDSSALAVRLTTGRVTVLFAGSLNLGDQRAWLDFDQNPASQFVVLPRVLAEEFLPRVKPETGIVFFGKSSRDQPKPETLAQLSGINLLRTDEHGTLELITDGQTVEVKSER